MYKIYVGEFRDKLPPLTYITSCKRCDLRKTIKYTSTIIKYGMDIYVKTPKGRLVNILKRKQNLFKT